MKKLFFVRSGSTCRMLRILAAVMLLLPVNLQPVRASRQDAGAKSSLTVKMKDATLSSVFAEVEQRPHVVGVNEGVAADRKSVV